MYLHGRQSDRERRTAHPSVTLPKIAASHGIIGAFDLRWEQISPAYLRYCAKAGILIKVGRGLYSLPGSNYGATAIASKLVPRGVLCLYSALYVHKLLDKPPERVWMAIGPKDRRPRHANMRFVRFSRAALTEGVERRCVEGISVRVYSVAKTLADCFKYRHKIDIRVGIDALTRAVRDHSCGRRELHHFAKICRVSKIMEPLLISAWRSR